MTTVLKTLTLRRREAYETSPGTLTGKMTIAGQSGEFTLELDDAASHRIAATVAGELVEAARRTATLFTAEVLQALPAPEVKA